LQSVSGGRRRSPTMAAELRYC